MIGPNAADFRPRSCAISDNETPPPPIQHGVAEQFEHLPGPPGFARRCETRSPQSSSLQLKVTASFKPCPILRKAARSGASKGVPRYCCSAFCATKSATISPSDTWILGKFVDRLRVNETEMQLVVLDRQPELVAHELDVALDRLRRDLQLVASLRQFGNFRACSCACSCIMRASGGRENCSSAGASFARAAGQRFRGSRTYHVLRYSLRRLLNKKNHFARCTNSNLSDNFCPSGCDMVPAKCLEKPASTFTPAIVSRLCARMRSPARAVLRCAASFAAGGDRRAERSVWNVG